MHPLHYCTSMDVVAHFSRSYARLMNSTGCSGCMTSSAHAQISSFSRECRILKYVGLDYVHVVLAQINGIKYFCVVCEALGSDASRRAALDSSTRTAEIRFRGIEPQQDNSLRTCVFQIISIAALL